MKRALVPFNLQLLILSPEQKRILSKITSLDMFDGPGGQFHDEGLFSTTIFGRPGEAKRDIGLAYIDLKFDILHPVVYKNIVKLKALYGDIMNGTEYAVFNEETKDFEKADILTGDTGYNFFVSRVNDLHPPRTNSILRESRLKIIDRYRGQLTMTALIVIPAGLRDLDYDSDGRTRMDEINNFYQRVIALTRNLPEKPPKDETIVQFDRTRIQVQRSIDQIYDYLEGILANKKGYIQQRFASRRIFNGTRGVLSSRDVTIEDLDDKYSPRFMDAVVGIYQHAKAVLPKTLHALQNGLLKEVFDTHSETVDLIDKKTLKRTPVDLKGTTFDRWYSPKGLESLIQSIETVERRHLPIEIEGHYLALVYADHQVFKVFRDISLLPEDMDPKYVHPITYVELIYLARYKAWYDDYATVTRYPITGMGSIVPVSMYTRTTIPAAKLHELDDNWALKEGECIAREFPLFPENRSHTQYHDSIALPPPTLGGLGADFDGDTVSLQAVYVDESIDEIKNYYRRREAYITPKGGLAFSVNIHTLALAIRNLTGPAS